MWAALSAPLLVSRVPDDSSQVIISSVVAVFERSETVCSQSLLRFHQHPPSGRSSRASSRNSIFVDSPMGPHWHRVYHVKAGGACSRARPNGPGIRGSNYVAMQTTVGS